MYFLDFVLDVLGTPAILIGLLALLGLLLQKKPFADVVRGTIKTIIGFTVLLAGAIIVVGSLIFFEQVFTYSFGAQGVLADSNPALAFAMMEAGANISLIVAFGFIVNILVARFTPLKYIYLATHLPLFIGAGIAVVLIGGGVSGVPLVAIGSITLGFVMALYPAIAQPIMRKITGTDDIGFAHTASLGSVITANFAKLFSKNSKSTEEMNFPKALGFLKDIYVTVTIFMFLIFLVLALIAGPRFVESEISGGQNFIVYVLIQAATFGGGLYVILSGVRLALAEIIPAFKGIAEKLVPNAKPALDGPVVFPYAPNAVVIGFLVSFAGLIVGMLICILLNAVGISVPIILPSTILAFFCGGVAGVFGNALGGRRGCVISAFSYGLLCVFLGILIFPFLEPLGITTALFADPDIQVIVLIFGNILRLFTGAG